MPMTRDTTPTVGTRADRQEELGQMAIQFIKQYGLGRFFVTHYDTEGSTPDLTREEFEELHEIAFDPTRMPTDRALYEHLTDERNWGIEE